jgi:hypothetical protein
MNNKKEEFSVNDFENFLKMMKETDGSNPGFEDFYLFHRKH